MWAGSRLATALPLQQLEIVVVYKQSGPVQTTQVQALQALGITRGISFRKLPVVGALATPGASASWLGARMCCRSTPTAR